MMPESTGHIVVWGCFCTDAADDPATLPDRCPGHDQPRLGEPVENMRDGPTQPGHACRETPCRPTPTPDPTSHVAALRGLVAPAPKEKPHA